MTTPATPGSQSPVPSTAEQAWQIMQQQVTDQNARLDLLTRENQHLQSRLASVEQQPSYSTPATYASLPTAALPRLAAPTKPDTYNGTRRVSAEVYLFNLKTYFKATGVVQEEQQINFAAAQLRETAATWWRRVCSTAANIPQTWTNFESAFTKQFTPVASKETARYTLHSMKQRGAAVGYCEAFSTCLLQFSDGDVSEGEQLFLFQLGLNKELQQQVRLMRPKTLDEAMSYAVQIEAENRNYSRGSNAGAASGRGEQNYGAYQNRNHPPRHNNNNNNQPGSTHTPMELGNVAPRNQDEDAYGQWEQDGAEELNAVGSRPPSRQLSPDQVKEYMRKGICFICAKPNHLARNCPTRTTRPQTQQRPKN